jgi:hypothetical protein
MKIKIKKENKIIEVEVLRKECQKYKCFSPQYWITQSIDYNHTQVDKYYSCSNRNYHGCPDKPVKN